eukprot:463638-Pleurochrysis_carterae.AAC.1
MHMKHAFRAFDQPLVARSYRLRLEREPLSERVGKGRRGPEGCPLGATCPPTGGARALRLHGTARPALLGCMGWWLPLLLPSSTASRTGLAPT